MAVFLRTTPGRAFRNKGHCAKQERKRAGQQIGRSLLNEGASKSRRSSQSGVERRDNSRRRLELLKARRPPGQRLGVRAPGAHLPVFVDIGRLPGHAHVYFAQRDRKRNDRGACERRHDVERREPERRAGALAHIVAHGARKRVERLLRLFDEHDAFGERELRAELVAREGDERVPGRGLRSREALRLAGAVADEVGGGIFDDFGLDLGHLRRDAVERRVHKLGQRHRRGIDRLALVRPFGGDRFRQRLRGRDQRTPCRRVDRPAVEENPVAALGGRRDRLLIEALRQGARRFARGLHRIALFRRDEEIGFEAGRLL